MLAFAFLVTAVGPVGLELQRCAILLGLVHGGIFYECKGSENFRDVQEKTLFEVIFLIV